MAVDPAITLRGTFRMVIDKEGENWLPETRKAALEHLEAWDAWSKEVARWDWAHNPFLVIFCLPFIVYSHVKCARMLKKVEATLENFQRAAAKDSNGPRVMPVL